MEYKKNIDMERAARMLPEKETRSYISRAASGYSNAMRATAGALALASLIFSGCAMTYDGKLTRFGAQRMNNQLTNELQASGKLEDLKKVVKDKTKGEYELDVEYGLSPEVQLAITAAIVGGATRGIVAAAAGGGGGGAAAAAVAPPPIGP